MKLLVPTTVLALVPAAVAAEAKPNILFILADDLGKEWLGCYGSEHATPRLDRLAHEGMRFTNAYVTPLCTPTRHTLLTGRYPFRTGWTVHHDSPRWGGLHLDWNREVTFARVLRSAGYATAIAGKWQINDLRVQPDALDRHGFDEHCVWPGFETGNPPSVERYSDAFIQHNGKRSTVTDEFGPDVFTDFLVDFMTRHKDQPFCAYYGMVLTHTPFTRTPDSSDAKLDRMALFPGMVDYTDRLVGRLVDTLDKLNIRQRTIIIFMTDNGTVRGPRCRANGRLIDGGKATLAETGICVPLIVNCPGTVPVGRVTDRLVDATDLLPTLAELTGASLPDGVTLDGRSYADVLLGRQDGRVRREWIFSQLGDKRVIRDKRYKLWSDGRFYDLDADPLEERDLAQSREREVVEVRARLGAVLSSLPADAEPFLPPGPPASERKGRKRAKSRPSSAG